MGSLTRRYIKVILLLWIQLSAYPCDFAENINIMCPPNFQPLAVESISNCSIKLSNDSINFEYALRNRISWEDGTIQRINTDMKIPKDYKTDENNKMILPNKWLLAYIDPDGPFNFISWRSDFKVLSLGLLTDENKEPIYVKINDTAGNCDVEIGGNYMITEIVKLFSDFIREKVELDRHYDYENIHLCYLSKFEWFEESPSYLSKQLFGIPFQEFGYKCCMVRENTVCCDDKLHRVEGYRIFPYIISIFLLTYFPILLMSFAIFAKTNDDYKSKKEYNKHSMEVPVCLRFPFFLRYNDYEYFHNENDKTKQGPKPAHNEQSPSKENVNDQKVGCFLSVLNWFLKRLKRLTFLLFFPSMIYFEFILLISDVEWKDLLQTIGKDDLLFGFPTMLGSLNNRNFLPPEGPMGALIMYYVFGFLIIVCPSDFENSVLGPGLEIFGKNTINIKSSYEKIKKILLKYMYLPLNTGYWKSCTWCTYLLRFFPIYSFPIIPFSIIALTGWTQYWFKKLEVERNSSSIFKIIFVFVLTLAFNIFYGIFVVILSYSIYLLFYILFFTSLGFIMSPNKQSKILIFIVSAIVFEYQIIRDSVHFYTEIFLLIVEICENDSNLKEKCITYHDNGQCIKEYLVVEVFRKIRPAFVQTGHIIIKTVIVILIYASALTFMLKFNDKISDVIERFSILITSVTPIILQWRLKTVCPKRLGVAQIIKKCVKDAEQKAKTAELNAQKADQNAKETEQKTNEAKQKTIEAEQKFREAEKKCIEAEQNHEATELIAKGAERITQEAKETEQNAKENARKAKEDEQNARETELTASESERKAREAELKAREAERKAREAERKAREAEQKTKAGEAEQNNEEAEKKAQETERKTIEAVQKVEEAKIKSKEAERKTGEDAQRAREAEQKAIEAEEKVREAERTTQEAKHAVQNAKESERNANEDERKAKIYEIQSKEHELLAREAKLNTIKDYLDTKKCALNIKEDSLNTKETQLGKEETKLKAQKAIFEKLKRKSMKDYQSIP